MMPFPVHKINGSPKLETGFQGGSQGGTAWKTKKQTGEN